MNTENSRPDEEEVLHAFSVEPRHDRATLDHYLNQYRNMRWPSWIARWS